MKTKKYTYEIVIQQFFNTWEDVDTVETNSMFHPLEGNKVYLRCLVNDYKLLGYPTRTIRRRTLNA